MRIWLTARTDIGLNRENNEDDYCLCSDLESALWMETKDYVPLSGKGTLAVVADGMGGPNAGEVASSLAIQVIKEVFSDKVVFSMNESPSETESGFKALFHAVQDKLIAWVNNHQEAIGMGTTLVILWLVGQQAYIAWCGDSRCYRFRKDTGLDLLTKDHSYVQELIDRGEIGEEEAFVHPDSNLITRGLGDIDAPFEPEFVACQVEEGDIFLLCSDGLCGSCRDATIEGILANSYRNLSECRDALVQAALDAGGSDNITVVLLATASDNADESSSFIAGIRRRLFPKNSA